MLENKKDSTPLKKRKEIYRDEEDGVTRNEPESEERNRRERQYKGREVVTSVEEVSNESRECSRK